METYPGTQLTPDGFAESPVQIHLGNEAEILDYLKQRGFSEEAIEAFRKGNPIQMHYEPTPFGISPSETIHNLREEEL